MLNIYKLLIGSEFLVKLRCDVEIFRFGLRKQTALKILTFVPLFSSPTALHSLTKTTVVDMRKHFHKAVVSMTDTGPKDETTAFP